MIDPALPLDPARLQLGLAAVNDLWRARLGEAAFEYTLEHFGRPKTLGDLFARYDFGEPDWNGTLCMLARAALVAEEHARTIVSTEELGSVERDGIQRFHHGDLRVDGDLGVFESTWVTGDLHVEGVIDASYLDAFADLFVGGTLRCRAVRFMGLALIGGPLEAETLVMVDSQGSNHFLGGIHTPLLLGESESTAEEDLRHVGQHVDLDDFDDDLPGFAQLVGGEVHADDTYPFEVLFRAFEALRADGD